MDRVRKEIDYNVANVRTQENALFFFSFFAEKKNSGECSFLKIIKNLLLLYPCKKFPLNRFVKIFFNSLFATIYKIYGDKGIEWEYRAVGHARRC